MTDPDAVQGRRSQPDADVPIRATTGDLLPGAAADAGTPGTPVSDEEDDATRAQAEAERMDQVSDGESG